MKHPRLGDVGHHQRFGGPLEQSRSVESVPDRQSSHLPDGVPGSRMTLHGDLTEGVDRKARPSRAVSRMMHPLGCGSEYSAARRFRYAQLTFVQRPVRLLHVPVRPSDLRNLAEGFERYRRIVSSSGFVLSNRHGGAIVADVSGVRFGAVEYLAGGIGRPYGGRDEDESRIGRAFSVVGMGGEDGAVDRGEAADGYGGAALDRRKDEGGRKRAAEGKE
mmetsp:Transcript_6627/g.19570  ORF Transcript_6627/g.19570 Transcript_6627/m.19570 type:complete len:218 (+) Transcript_6627:1908-2561(+)